MYKVVIKNIEKQSWVNTRTLPSQVTKLVVSLANSIEEKSMGKKIGL